MAKGGGWRAASPAAVLLLSALLVPFVAYGDFRTGPEVGFDLFYVVPVSLAAWFAGRWRGLTLAGLCGVASGTVEFIEAGRYIFWNASVHLAVFGLLAIALSALRETLEKERVLARTDALTGVANRRMFLDAAGRELERSRRYGHPFSLAILDLDNFKAVNDERGHAEGDAVLRSAAESLRSSLRSTDTVARLGGDEFAAFLPETGPEAALEVYEKLRERMQEAFRLAGWPVTVSLGAVTYRTPPGGLDAVIRDADLLLYRAKGAGKDSLVHEAAR